MYFCIRLLYSEPLVLGLASVNKRAIIICVRETHEFQANFFNQLIRCIWIYLVVTRRLQKFF